MSGIPPISPFRAPLEGSNGSSKPKKKTRTLPSQNTTELRQPSTSFVAQKLSASSNTVNPPPLPPITPDLLGIVEERERERGQQSQAHENGRPRRRTEATWEDPSAERTPDIFDTSTQAPENGHSRRRTEAMRENASAERTQDIFGTSSGPTRMQYRASQRKLESAWEETFNSSCPSYRDRRSQASSSSSGPSNPRSLEEQNLRNGRNHFSPSPGNVELSTSSPFDTSSSTYLDPFTQQFIQDIRKLGLEPSEIDFSEYTHDELNEFRSLVLEMLHQDPIEETETPEGTPSISATEVEKFQILYTAVATTVDPDLHVEFPQEMPATFTYVNSTNDKGGHGGTKKVTLDYRGQKYRLFLKPKDRAEVLGYDLTMYFDQRRQDTQVSPFMAKTYGVVTIDNREYFVMQDLTANGNDPIMDVKPAFCIKNLDNPIASKKEIKRTGRSKPFLDYFQMKLGAQMSGGYMIAHPEKIKRFGSYARSQRTFKKNLHKHYTLDKIIQMRNQLKAVQCSIPTGQIAYIGSSFLFLKDGLYFIDPAHPQVNPAEEHNPNFRERFANDLPRIYFGTDDEFQRRRASTIFSIELMLQHMEEVIKEKEVVEQDGAPLDTESERLPPKTRLSRQEPKQIRETVWLEKEYKMRPSEQKDGPPLNTGASPFDTIPSKKFFKK